MCFFFFEQKTAYDLRNCDWSSDVCSSDLASFFSLFFLASLLHFKYTTWQNPSFFFHFFLIVKFTILSTPPFFLHSHSRSFIIQIHNFIQPPSLFVNRVSNILRGQKFFFSLHPNLLFIEYPSFIST